MAFEFESGKGKEVEGGEREMKSKKLILGLVILAIIVIVDSSGIVSAFSNSSGGDWKYYREITIKENSGKNLSDYQILVELNSSSFPANAKSDGSDIRFSDKSGKELDYWIGGWNFDAKNAKVWVKVPFIPSQEETKIRMYYGNIDAEDVSDIHNTFIFGDDFENPTWTENHWVSVSGTWETIDGVYKVKTSNDHGVLANETFKQDIAVDLKLKVDKGYPGFYPLWHDEYNYTKAWYGYQYDETTKEKVDAFCTGHSYGFPSNLEMSESGQPISWDKKEWQNFSAIIFDGKCEVFAPVKPGIVSVSVSRTSPEEGRLELFANGSACFDDVRVRKYTSPEPSLTFSQEYSTAPTPIPTPTLIPTLSPTPTLTPSPTPVPTPTPPGFEAIFAIAGLVAVAYILVRRRG